ncbi:hypothetical protein HPULCUR_002114 [Helicostylum pulchrum]|uniref:GED domain-containing protein n=1 Tax=Helicostylum pulchrum TaxID=562976 RepID=A0ABP9XPN6_9FUNG
MGFVRDNDEAKEIITTWFEVYNNYEDALHDLKRMFSRIYKDINKKSCVHSKSIDLEPLFDQSVANKSLMQNGTKLATSAAAAASGALLIRLNLNKTPTTIPTTTPSILASTTQKSTAEIKYNDYINFCKNKSKKYGFDLLTEIQQVLACKNIILFKAHQYDQELLKRIDAEEHATNITASIMKDTIKIDDKVYSDLTAILREVNEKTNRRNLKIQLNKLFERASEEDGKLIEVFINLLNKLPNFERLEAIGELELTTNFLDPIFSALFHDPAINKHFIWLNRQDENTGVSRPDGVMTSVPKKAESVTLGYCEVKPQDVEANGELAFADLIRLSTFSRDLLLRKENKKAISIQAIGYRVVIYFIEETFPGVTIMSEILSFNVPSTICGIAGLINKIDQLKRVRHILDTECQSRYKYPRPLTDDTKADINTKRRKSRTLSFSLL